MNKASAKVWIILDGVFVTAYAIYVIAEDADRLRGAWTAGAMAILFGIVFLTLEAIHALWQDDHPAAEPLAPKAIMQPNPTFWWPIWGYPVIEYAQDVFLTVGPVREQTGPVPPGSKRHYPKRIATMALILTDTQQVTLAISGGADKKGNPATLPPGVPAWTVSDPTILAVTPAADGLSAVVTAVGAIGTAQVQAVVGGLTGVLDVQVTAGSATSVLVTAGTPTEQGS